jgi:hypothetical protein
MPRYALVELTNPPVVLNVAYSSSTSVASVPPPPSSAFRNLIENLVNPAISDWTPGNDPKVGDIWDGAIPAGFSAAPPPPTEDIEKSANEIIDEIRAKATEMLGRADALEAKLG